MSSRQAPVSEQSIQAKDDMNKLAFGALRCLQKLPRLVKSCFQQLSANMPASDFSL